MLKWFFPPPAPRLGQSTIFVLQQSPPVQHIDRTRLKRIRPSLRWHFNHHSFVMCSPGAQSLSSCAPVCLSTRAMAALTQRPEKAALENLQRKVRGILWERLTCNDWQTSQYEQLHLWDLNCWGSSFYLCRCVCNCNWSLRCWDLGLVDYYFVSPISKRHGCSQTIRCSKSHE